MKIKFPWKIVKLNTNHKDTKIEQIKNILFPPLKLNTTVNDSGEQIKYYNDYSIDSNLDALLSDLQDGYNDENVHKTLQDIIKRVEKVRKLLEIYVSIDNDAQYIIVETQNDTNHLDNIRVSDEKY